MALDELEALIGRWALGAAFPGAPPIDFPGMTVLQYAGDGKFSLEEDFWSLPEGTDTAKRYAAAGRTDLLPIVTFVASFVAQTNLAQAPVVAVPLALVTPAIVRALRPPSEPPGKPTRFALTLRICHFPID